MRAGEPHQRLHGAKIPEEYYRRIGQKEGAIGLRAGGAVMYEFLEQREAPTDVDVGQVVEWLHPVARVKQNFLVVLAVGDERDRVGCDA